MTPFGEFSDRCKMRYDFSDQIQVRYEHVDGKYYDTWVSGTEALQRLESVETERQLRSLSRLSTDELRLVLEALPEATRNMVRHTLRDRLADGLESTIGGNLIGDALSDVVRGQTISSETAGSERERWRALMHYEPFRLKLLELAWIALEGSFPDTETESEPDDWI